MTEFIVRITDEQEATIRRFNAGTVIVGDFINLQAIANEVLDQCIAALKLYDQLVTEAKAASDE